MSGLKLAPDYTEFLQLYYKYPSPYENSQTNSWGGGAQSAPYVSSLTEPCLLSRDVFLSCNGVSLPVAAHTETAPRAHTPHAHGLLHQVEPFAKPTKKQGGSPLKASTSQTPSADTDEMNTVKFVQGKMSTAVFEPEAKHTARRLEVEAQIARMMDDVPFSLKCQIYREELPIIVKEQHNSNVRTHVPLLRNPPQLRLNTYERGLLESAGPLADMPGSLKEPSMNLRGRSNEDVVQEVLNSLTNRMLFLVMIEYRSWFPQERARTQIVKAVCKALSPEPLNVALATYVGNFVVQRTKNFRDVISRVCKRDRNHSRSSGSSMED